MLRDNIIEKKDNYFSFIKYNQIIRFMCGERNDYIIKSIKNNNDFYENSLLDFLVLLNLPDGIILDIGANIGNHTIFFAKFLKKPVFAFEPCKENFNLLNENIKLNNLNKFVKIFNFALGEKKTKGIIKILQEGNSGAIEILEKAGGEIDIFPGDNIKELYENKISMIKIDTEGSEKKILKGLSNILNINKPLLIIECFDEYVMKEIIVFLKSLNYKPVKIFNATPTLIFSTEEKYIDTFGERLQPFLDNYLEYKKTTNFAKYLNKISQENINLKKQLCEVNLKYRKMTEKYDNLKQQYDYLKKDL